YGFAEFSVAVTSRELSGRALLEMGEDKILTIFSDAKLSRRKHLKLTCARDPAQKVNKKKLSPGYSEHLSRSSYHLPSTDFPESSTRRT
ncbi:unnamed protein product, partial [Ixodes hexagonus]